MRFCSLGSGSSGNATVVESRSGDTVSRLLVDCGFSLRELERRLARAQLAPADVDAVFITHEHGDHIGCALSFARRHQRPLWMSHGTWQAIGEPALPDLMYIARDGSNIAVGGLRLTPFAVPHDAREPLQLRCADDTHVLGIFTDVGSITPYALAHLQGLDALLLECNHDRGLLTTSAYPASVQARIGGPFGHLANDTAAEALAACWHSDLQHLVAMHLSPRTNRPDLAQAALRSVCGGDGIPIVVADPHAGFGWLSLG